MSNHQRVTKGYQLYCLVLLWVYVCLSMDSSVNGLTLQDLGSPDLITSPGTEVETMASTVPSVTTAEIAKPTPTSPSLETSSSKSDDILTPSIDDQYVEALINNSTDGHVSSESASSSAGTTKNEQETTAASFSAMIPTAHSSQSNHSLDPSEGNPDGQTTAVTSTTSNVIDSSTAQKKKDPNKTQLGIVILVVIVVLVLLFLVMLFLLLRKKRRSGSQNFSKRSQKSNGENVWAGQVPELAEGNGMVENGTVAPTSQVRVEQEMTTFGEKRDDSVVEMEELGAVVTEKQSKKDSVTSEEQKPLLEEDFEGSTAEDKGAKEEQFLLPPPYQDMAGNGDQANAAANGDS